MARTKKSSVKPVEKREVSRKVINGAFIIFFDDGSIQIIAKPIDLTKEEVSSLFGSSEEEEEEEETDNEQEWKRKLTPLQYDVLRRKGTERPFTGRYYRFSEDGTYSCAACGNPIFMSQDKFDSGCGWPSFDKAIPGHVKFTPDFSHGLERIEVTCARCGSHLGHVFEDGPTETGDRFCINSAAMNFTPEKDTAKN